MVHSRARLTIITRAFLWERPPLAGGPPSIHHILMSRASLGRIFLWQEYSGVSSFGSRLFLKGSSSGAVSSSEWHVLFQACHILGASSSRCVLLRVHSISDIYSSNGHALVWWEVHLLCMTSCSRGAASSRPVLLQPRPPLGVAPDRHSLICLSCSPP